MQVAITESEWIVMQAVWDAPPKSLQEILLKLKDSGWSTTTIQTYLARLVKKGALTTQRQGKGYLYYPAVTEKACQLSESKSFLNRVYGGSLSSMVAGFVKGGTLSQKELAALKDMLEEQERKYGG